MLNKIKVVIVFVFFYQSAVYSNITSFNDFKSKNLSNYFSGLVATENKNNSEALDFFNSSKILINRHNPYLEKYIYSLVLENKISQAINEIKRNKKNENSNFFDAYLLLILDSLKKNDLDQANLYLSDGLRFVKEDRFNLAILESLNQFIFSFKEKKILDNKKNFGTLSLISETFQRCYLGDKKTGAYFSNLINDNEADYSRYVYFYLSYLVESGRELDAKIVADDINYINTSLLLSQGKSWIDKKNFYKFKEVFSCKNYNDIISEFLFLISNLYSSQDDFIKSNFYLNLSNFLNPKFTFNLSLVAENYFLNKQYKKTMKVLRNFIEEDDFYYWYRIKKEAQIIKEQNNENLSLDFITRKFNEIDQPSNKQLFDIANFYRNSKKYKKAIKYYTEILDSLDEEF